MTNNGTTHGDTAMTSPDTIRMRARYRDTCRTCRQAVNVGDRIEWDRTDRKVTCYACATRPAPMPDVLAWSERHQVGTTHQHPYHDEAHYAMAVTAQGLALLALTPDGDLALRQRIGLEIERETRTRPWPGCSWVGHLVNLEIAQGGGSGTAVVAYCWPIGD